MKKNVLKSSITLPPNELQLVETLKKKLKAKSKVEVIRRGLELLSETTQREELRLKFSRASHATRVNRAENAALDLLSDEGLD